MLKKYRLRTKLLLLLSVVFIAGFITQGYLSTSSLYKIYIGKLQQEHYNRVTTSADFIERKLMATHDTLIAVAKVLPLAKLSDPDALQAWLNDRRGLLNSFDNSLFIFNDTGELLVETPFKPGRRGRSFSFRPYFQETIRTRKPYISEPYISTQKHNHPVIMMTAPVFDAEGKVKAILSGSLDLLGSNCLGSLSQQKIGKKGFFFLAGMDRTLIIHPDPTRIMQQDIPEGANTLFDRAMQGFEGAGETTTSEGIKTMAAFKKLTIKDWVLAGYHPMNEIDEPLRSARNISLLVMGGTFLAMFIVILLFFQIFFKPLQRFTGHLSALADKKDEARLFDYEGNDEFGILIKTFNQMLQKMDQAQQSLDEAQRIAQIGNLSWAVNRNRITCSNELARILQIEADATLTLENYLTCVHPDDRDIVQTALTDVLHDTESTIEHRIVVAGKIKWVRLIAALNGKGSTADETVICTIQDISEQKNAEKTMLALTVQLSRKNEELESFTYAASHDLKAPLRGIKHLAEWLSADLGEHLNENSSRYLALLNSRVERMEALLEGLLQYSRLGRVKTDVSTVDTAQLIRGAVDLLSLPQGFKVEIADNMPRLETMSAPLAMVFRNLISNAVQHHDRSQGLIKVSVAPEKDFFAFAIQDDGPGIPLEFQHKVFEIFQTLRPRDEIEGSGLGLAMVKKAVEQQGGKVYISSQPEQQRGTTVIFSWPKKPEAGI